MTRRDRTLETGFPTAVPIRHGDDLGPKAQRTVERIIASARGVFLANGYAGTTIDEIARVAAVSRGSIYTYFPTKRDVLVAVGADSVRATEGLIESLERLGRTRAGLGDWVSSYFEFLDVHGAFAFAWTEAAQNDDEIRVAGMKGHLRMCRDFSRRLSVATGRAIDEPETFGLTMVSMLERLWSYGALYSGRTRREVAVDQAASTIWSAVRA
ncbi:MAG: TetR/AcrR family transcriptional regulator [Actinomycetota bacterium]